MDEAAIVPERLLGSDELGEALDQALKSLPQRQQQTFMLRIWEGLPSGLQFEIGAPPEPDPSSSPRRARS